MLTRILLVLLSAWGASGCYVVSVSGVADSSTAAFDESLLGRWRSTEDEVDLRLERDEWRTYTVTLRDRTGERRFTGRLCNIAGVQIFDLTMHSGTETSPTLLPIHILGRVSVKDATLIVDLLDYEWFRGRMARGSLLIPAALDERETLVLTASREQLHRWMASHIASKMMFSEFLTLTRDAEASR